MNSFSSFHKQYVSIVIFTVFSATLFFSCNNKKKDGPKLVIKEEPIELSEEEPAQSLLIANIGEGTLNWSIDDLPPWVEVSSMEGSLEPGPDEIIFTGDLGFESGVHSQQVEITSNGGNRSFQLTFDQTRTEFDIYPGVGISDIILENSYSEVKSVIGEPDTVVHYLYEDPETYYLHVGMYENLGLVMVFFNYSKSVINDPDPLVTIRCLPPFSGTTNEGIGIGSSLEDVEAEYGVANDTAHIEEEDYFLDRYNYNNLGISFVFFDGNFTSAQFVEIFEPFNSTVQPNKRNNKFRNLEFRNKFLRPQLNSNIIPKN